VRATLAETAIATRRDALRDIGKGAALLVGCFHAMTPCVLLRGTAGSLIIVRK
jgi:hypothetical protein